MYLSFKIFLSKHFIAEVFEVGDFVIVDRDKDHAVFPQQVPGEVEPREHHVEPVGVEASGSLGVGGEFSSERVLLAGQFEIVFRGSVCRLGANYGATFKIATPCFSMFCQRFAL